MTTPNLPDRQCDLCDYTAPATGGTIAKRGMALHKKLSHGISSQNDLRVQERAKKHTPAEPRYLSFNINDTVQVVLTKDGADIYNHYWKNFSRGSKVAGQTIDLPVWELTHVFGPILFMGSTKMPFLNNQVQIALPATST